MRRFNMTVWLLNVGKFNGGRFAFRVATARANVFPCGWKFKIMDGKSTSAQKCAAHCSPQFGGDSGEPCAAWNLATAGLGEKR
jgi:hypothetical protein